MAADVLESDSSNHCCAKLKQKYLKLKDDRNFLRNGMKIVDERIEKLVKENLQLQKDYAEQQLCGKQEKEEKVKESNIKKKLEKEIHDLKEKISSYQGNECLMDVNDDENKLLKVRVLEGQDEIIKLKELLKKEKKKSESEKKKAELEKKKANEAWKLVKEEKVKADEERKLAEVVRKKSEEYRMSWEKAKSEAKELKAELSKANDARKRVEEEKRKISMEKARADSQIKKLMEAERKKPSEEKARKDYLSQSLEEEKRRGGELQKKLEDVESTSKGRYDSSNGGKMYVGIINANMKLLREQLKLEKKQAKYAKRMAKLEKAEKGFIMQEHHILKHSFMQMLSRFNLLDARLSHSIEGTDAVAKIDKPCETHNFKLENSQLGSKRVNHCSNTDCGLRKTCCTGSFNLTEPTRDFVGFPLPRSSCTRRTTGTNSELESPVGGRNKSQSSAICLNTSYSDKRSMGSQERGSIAIPASAKLTKKRPNKKPTVMKLPSEVVKTSKSKELAVVTNNADTTYGHREVGNACLIASMNDANKDIVAEFNHSLKRRKAWDTMEPVATGCAESKQSYFEIGKRLAASEDNLNVECQGSARKCSQGCGISHNCFNENDHFSEDHNKSGRPNCNCSSNIMTSKHQTPVLEALGQNVNEKQHEKLNSLRSRVPSFAAVTTPPSHQVRGNIRVPPDLIDFESMIRGNCLKLLDLDNVADEERYRTAVEMPLSPILPNFELPNNQLHVEDGTHCVMERENLVPRHSVDVLVMEISASNASGKLLSHDSQDSLYPTKVSGYNRVIELQDCAGKHGRLNDAKDHPSISDNHGSLNVEQMYPAGKSGDSMIDTVMLPFVGGHNALANANACSHSVSDIIDKPLLSDMAGSFMLQDDECPRGSSGKIDNFLGCSSSVVIIQDKSRRHVDGTTASLVENQTETKDVASDGTIIFSSCLSSVVNIQDKSRRHVDGTTASLVENQTEAKDVASDRTIIFSSKNQELTKDTNIHQLSEVSKQTALFTSCDVEDTSRVNPDAEVRKSPLCCVVFTNIKDKDSICRIFRMRDAFSHQNFIVSQIDHVVKQVHNALAMNTALLPQEKGSIFFSLLLCNVSSRMSANFKSTKSEDLLPCFESFAADINKVLSDAETKLLFAEICQLDVLASIIKDFLMERKVLLYIDRLYECNDISSSLFQLDGAYVFSRAATIDQFVTGCIILASISAAADRIDFLLETSYEILRMCRSDISWILFALHVFASVCRKEFFNANEYSFLIIALRSVVLLLERGDQSVSSIISPCFHSAFDTVPTFSPCNECPFARGAICMDKLTNLLLDVLQCYTVSLNVVNSGSFSVRLIPACTNKDEDSEDSKSELHGQSNAFDASRCIILFNKLAADLPDKFPVMAFCHFTDIVSLMELIGLYMGWEWTIDKIIPRLSKMLEFCKIEEFSAALFVLVGQLGRFGIDGGGHEKKGISELRHHISVFIDSSIAGKMHLRTQFAAIGALLHLLSLSFRDIVGNYEELALDTSHLGHARLIKKWYLDLSKHQQSLCLNLFE